MTQVPPELPGFDLTDAFFKRQKQLEAGLGIGDIATHSGTKGSETELNWLRMLAEFLPRRYGVTSAFVIDSHGGLSDQLDVVIHDQHFSPLLFEVGGAKYIPAECVYAAFEVKQELDKGNLEYAADKVASVRRLHRTTIEVPHLGGKYDPVIPRRIIGGVLVRRSDWTPPFGESFEKCLIHLDSRDPQGLTWALDIGCAVEHGGFVVKRDEKGGSINIDHSEPGIALIYFVMRLMRLLQVMGSPPAIDYDAYLNSVPGTD